MSNYKIFSGTSHKKLAEKIAGGYQKLGNLLVEDYPDGEIKIQVQEDVRGRDVFIVQSIAKRPHYYLMEMLIIADAMRRSFARSVVAVVPYFGYGRQDRRERQGEAITARLVADLLERGGISGILTMDLHAKQIEGFFNIPLYNLSARSLITHSIKKLNLKDFVVVSPDIGSVRLARRYGEDLKVDLAIVDKERLGAKEVQVNALIGDVRGKDVVLIDDISSTGTTLRAAAQLCKERGAKKIFAAVTHSFDVSAILEDEMIEKFLTANTIANHRFYDHHKVKVIEIAGLFREMIKSFRGFYD